MGGLPNWQMELLRVGSRFACSEQDASLAVGFFCKNNFAYCLLPTAYCLLPTAYCLPPKLRCCLLTTNHYDTSLPSKS